MSWLKDNDQVLSTDFSSVPAAESRAREDKAQAGLQFVG
jgi:hypothetical protein